MRAGGGSVLGGEQEEPFAVGVLPHAGDLVSLPEPVDEPRRIEVGVDVDDEAHPATATPSTATRQSGTTRAPVPVSVTAGASSPSRSPSTWRASTKSDTPPSTKAHKWTSLSGDEPPASSSAATRSRTWPAW